MVGTVTDPPHHHRLTVEDYYRMGEIGILRPDERLELIEGEIIDMAPPGELHAGTVDQLVDLLKEAVGRRAIVRVQNPVLLDRYSEPQPDLALLRPRTDFYKKTRPGAADVLLAIEVADTSLRYDRDVKVPLYARHGIAEVWLIDVRGKRLTRHRAPTQGAYRAVDEPGVTRPLELGNPLDVKVDLGALFDE
jgi:Uma2 family endonuclease